MPEPRRGERRGVSEGRELEALNGIRRGERETCIHPGHLHPSSTCAMPKPRKGETRGVSEGGELEALNGSREGRERSESKEGE